MIDSIIIYFSLKYFFSYQNKRKKGSKWGKEGGGRKEGKKETVKCLLTRGWGWR